MRLERCVFRSIGPFDGTWELDLRPYPQGSVICLSAPNGSGKSFALENAFLGGLYRSTATQGAPLARALGRDGFLEATFVYEGNEIALRHLLDGVAKPKKAEALVLVNGKAPYESTKVTAFDAWVEKHLPAEELLRATIFRVQGSEGFIELGSAGRIDVVLEATGVARIERAAVAARARAKEASSDLAAVCVRIADAKQGAPEIDAALAHFEEYRDASALAEARVTNMRKALADAEEAAARRAELELVATLARDTRERLARELDAARQRVQGLGQRYAAADPQAARDAADRAEHALATARAALTDAEKRSRAADAARAAALTASESRAALETAAHAASAAVADLSARVENGLVVIAEAESIRSAVVRAAGLREELAAHDAAVAAAHARATAAERAREQAAGRISAIERRLERAKEALVGREEVAAAQLCLPNLERVASEARAELERAHTDLDALRDQRAASADERITALRTAIDETLAGEDEFGVDTEPLRRAKSSDDAAVQLAAELPARTAAALAAKGASNARAAAAEAELAAARTIAARSDAMLAAEQDFGAAERELAEVHAARAGHDAEVTAAREAVMVSEAAATSARDALDAIRALAAKAENLAKAESVAELRATQLAEATATSDRLWAELAALPPPAALPPAGAGIESERAAVAAAERAARAAAEALGAAEATRRELEPQASDVRATLERLATELAAAPPPPDLPPPVDVTLARAEAESAERVARGLTTDVALAEQRVEQAKGVAARLAELDAQRRELEADLADWTRLALDLGRDGVQSALVDSAGPELTEITNDLLRCHGTRYTVSIETQRASADGKSTIDECRVQVIDTVAGTDKEAREHSGGERVILAEAISLALTTLACRRAGMTDVSIVRDESGAALDPENARAYVAMLRRAVKAIGARHVLLVTHSDAVKAMCDAIIELPVRRSAHAIQRREDAA